MRIRQNKNKGYRTVILLGNGKILSKNTDTREEVDEFVLSQEDVKMAKIRDNRTGEIEIVRF